MNKAFFPASIKFWVINLGCWGIVYALLNFGSFLTGEGVVAQAVATFIYVALGVFAGLLYRYLYHLLGWNDRSVPRLVLTTLGFIAVEGVLIGALATFYVYVLSGLRPTWLGPIPDSMPFRFFLLYVFFANAINIAAFQGLWSAIYVVIAYYRKSTRQEVKALRLENSLKQAQLSTLSSQLNPHFLFNALNNIRFMMRKDANQAEEMLTHLSDLLRYALESSRQQKVSVQQELDIVEHYISLAKIQFDDRLNFVKQIKLDAKKYLMPPMLLQILMENAIKHGADKLKTGGELQLFVSERANMMEMRVSNNVAKDAETPTTPGLGMGLENIVQRLELLYGGDGKLSVAHDQLTFTVIVTLPKEAV